MDDISSYHVTGTQFVFADGSVKWIAQDIDPCFRVHLLSVAEANS